MSFLAIAPTDYLEIEGIRIPKYGSVTVAEYLFLRDFFKTPRLDIGGQFQLFADFQQRQTLATLLLISRSSPTWTLDEVTNLFSVEHIYELSNWILGEWLGWKPIKPQSEPSESAPELDWEDVFWRLQLWYPNEPRFKSDAIGSCPLSVIEKACEVYRAERKASLHLQELGVATLTAVLANCHKSAKARPSKPSDFFYFDDGEYQIPSKICNGFWALAQSGKLPNWAIQYAPHDALKRGKSNAPLAEIPYWIGEQIVVFAPELDGQNLFAPLVIVDCPDAIANAYEPDTNMLYEIRLPEDCQGRLAVIEFESLLER